MRFLVDESTGPAVARWLHDQGHAVFSVHDVARGIDDDQVIQKAFAENWILITNDKDFGEKVYREQRPHRGVVLLRLDDERAASKIDVLQRLLAGHAERLTDNFVVVTESRVRFARK
jgi:predicted nuclease of predicted toxin-antitoxin system